MSNISSFFSKLRIRVPSRVNKLCMLDINKYSLYLVRNMDSHHKIFRFPGTIFFSKELDWCFSCLFFMYRDRRKKWHSSIFCCTNTMDRRIRPPAQLIHLLQAIRHSWVFNQLPSIQMCHLTPSPTSGSYDQSQSWGMHACSDWSPEEYWCSAVPGTHLRFLCRRLTLNKGRGVHFNSTW